MLKNILCDRDGTIIYDKHYLADPDGVELLPEALFGLKFLVKAGCKIFVVSNQSGIGRGIFSLEDYNACALRLEQLLRAEGVELGDTVFCPHAPDQEQNCACRKPATGMWTDLRKRHGLKAEQSVMVGDKSADIMFGKNAGLAATVLVLTGKGAATAAKLGLPLEHPELDSKGFYEPSTGPGIPDCVALNLKMAASYILQKNLAK